MSNETQQFKGKIELVAVQWMVKASEPTCGFYNASDTREVGPFSSHARAEDAAARLVDDPRRFAKIEIVPVDGEVVS